MTESNEQQSKVASFFDYEEYGTDTKTEVIAGITTFLTMSYIIVINPAILSAAISIDGYSDGEVFQMIAITTILAAVVGTAVMALYANRPFDSHPEWGSMRTSRSPLSSHSVSCGKLRSQRCSSRDSSSWRCLRSARGDTSSSSSLKPVKFAVGAGIGLFLLLLGFIEMNAAAARDSTLVTLGSVASDPVAILSLVGLAFTLVLYSRDVTGSIIIGILTTAIVGWGLTVAGVVNDGLLTPGPSLNHTTISRRWSAHSRRVPEH